MIPYLNAINMETVSKVDKQIESLPKKELHKLKSLIRITYFHSKEDMARNKEILFSNKWWRESQGIRKLEQVIALYEKAGVSEADSQHHWLFNRNEQIALHYSQKHMAKPERKDNKTYINFGNHCSNRNKIRYPKKCRKTAWKRFYKLFPHLKPEEENIVTNLN